MPASNTARTARFSRRRSWAGSRASSSPSCRSEVAMIRHDSNAQADKGTGGGTHGVYRAARAVVRALALVAMLVTMQGASAERIKDLASIQGVRGNPLIGYGLVVGLDGSGDQTTQTPFTVQSVLNMLTQMGVNLPPGT